MSDHYYLLLHPNRQRHYYTTRRNAVTLGVIHTGEGVPDYDPPDMGAENLARYASTTVRAASWHDTCDSDTRVDLLPRSYTAFHVRGYNSRAVGLEQATQAARWATSPASWREDIIAHAAEIVAEWVKEFDLPIRQIGKAQADAGMKGLVSHGDLDPTRRSDPGKDYPWGMLLQYTADIVGMRRPEPTPAPPPNQPRVQSPGLLRFGDRGDEVLAWQRDLKRWNPQALERYGADGHFGGECHDWTRRFQKAVDVTDDGIVGANTRAPMERVLRERDRPDRPGMPPPPARLLRLATPNLRGGDVRAWQEGLNRWRINLVKTDGVFGPVTYDATKIFQRAAKVRVDGVVGSQTWTALDMTLRSGR